MQASARAPGAGTVLNALATGVGCAFAVDLFTTAQVTLREERTIDSRIEGEPDADTTLIELALQRTLDVFEVENIQGGSVVTSSEIPMAAGLKSSSAAANATVLATVAALGKAEEIDRVDATRLGVVAAREAGVTVTGAFDDASASMLGGVTITDNHEDKLLTHEPFDGDVAIHTPDLQAFSADADVERCERIAPVADVVAELAREGDYGPAMIINGFAYSAALGFSSERMIEALPGVRGVSLSGTGPSTVAVGSATAINEVVSRWERSSGTVRRTTVNNTGATIV